VETKEEAHTGGRAKILFSLARRLLDVAGAENTGDAP